jgi:hypothetical protein
MKRVRALIVASLIGSALLLLGFGLPVRETR